MTTLKADTITGTSGITNFLQSPTMPTQAYTTNLYCDWILILS